VGNIIDREEKGGRTESGWERKRFAKFMRIIIIMYTKN